MRAPLLLVPLVLPALALAGCGLRADVAESLTAAPAASTATATATTTATTAVPAPAAPTVPPSSAAPSSEPPTPSGPSPRRVPALELVGRWHVTGDGVAAGTALVLGEQLNVFLPCGVLDGEWRADGEQGLFVASSSGGDSTCFGPSGRAPLPWLDDAARFDAVGEQRRLLDRDGRSLAVLRPGAEPTVGPDRSADAAAEPVVTPRLRARLADAAPLPPGTDPVTAGQLVGRWTPEGVAGEAHLRFGPDGSYTGSDGCNGQGGRYVLGGRGRLLGTSGPQTLIGCAGAPVGGWVAQAARAGLADGVLVLHDADGAVLGRLRRG